jgi:hypothetical protein
MSTRKKMKNSKAQLQKVWTMLQSVNAQETKSSDFTTRSDGKPEKSEAELLSYHESTEHSMRKISSPVSDILKIL